MEYFPLFIRLKDRLCLIIGGGEIAYRKARLLAKGGARIDLIAPEFSSQLRSFAEQKNFNLHTAEFGPDQSVEGYSLVIAATDNATINRQVAESARQAGIPCNVVDNRDESTAIMPAIIDRDPIVVAISSGGSSPVLATRIRKQLEQQYPPQLAALAQFAEDWRVRVKQAFPDTDQRRHFWHEVFDGPVAASVLAGKSAAAERGMQNLIDTPESRGGFAWITGAGPGDPELLTLKAARALAAADTILHDRLVAPAILEMARRDAEFISVGKQAGRPGITQEEINTLLVARVAAGQRVCRLKGGDPFVFGRGGEEIEALEAARLPWEAIPGISAAAGSAATLGLPLTHRQIARSITYITASTADDAERDWAALSSADQTLAIYMAVKRMPKVCSELVAAGRAADEAALVIENGTTEHQRVVRGTLSTIAGACARAEIVSPAVLIVGRVTDLDHIETGAGEEKTSKAVWAAAAHAK